MTYVVAGGATGRLGNIVCRPISESEDLEPGATVSVGGGNVGREMFGAGAVGPDRLSETLRDADVYADPTAPDAAAEIAAGVPETVANMFWRACEMLAGRLPGHDIKVVAHHGDKEDAPSGIDRTAYGRKGAAGPRVREVGVHPIRAGDIAEDRTVLFARNPEVIKLTHRAGPREASALGCVGSTRWISGKKDGKVHSMDEVLGIC